MHPPPLGGIHNLHGDGYGGMLRPKTVKGATANLAAYLINNQPMPDNPIGPAHRVPWKVSESSVTSSSPGRKNIRITAVVLSIALPRRTLATISHRAKSTKLAIDALHVLVLIAMILMRPKNTTVNSAVLIARATRFER
jgi:hypothetical protein